MESNPRVTYHQEFHSHPGNGGSDLPGMLQCDSSQVKDADATEYLRPLLHYP
jgi:hypothetical protein